ncbi:MAG: hypothetical protein M3115_02715 [Thermoproteota archaeon]|nr:hypothetical protein [Thermoproteota archaeon]
MTDQFAFLQDKLKTAIVALSLSVLLLLPASLGFGGTILQEAYAQFNLPLLEEDTEETEDGGLVVEEETTTTTTTTPPATTTTTDIPDPAAYMLASANTEALRGFIGATLTAPGVGGNAVTPADDSGHIVTGPFRLFANDTLVRRFVAEMNVAAIDGSSFHNITIEQDAPHRFEVTQGNETTGAAEAVSSIVGRIFLDGSPAPVITNVPMTISVRGQSLAIQNIDIDEASITDPGQRDAMSIIDGQTIYGTIPRL